MSDITLNHLALVVDNLDAALDFWCGRIGLTRASETQTVSEEAVTITFLQMGDARLELIQPVSADSGVAKYLTKRGPGMHHLCLEVADLDAKLTQLRGQGVELINETPRERGGKRYAFIHPESSGGVLLELYERL